MRTRHTRTKSRANPVQRNERSVQKRSRRGYLLEEKDGDLDDDFDFVLACGDNRITA